jgi:hypothetical protein
MNLSEWRAKQAQGEEIQLPSGLEIRARQLNVLDLVQQGKIPQTLQPQIELFTRQANTVNSLDMIEKLGELMIVAIKAAIVEPADLDVEELPFADRIALFAWLNEDAGKVSSFRVGKAKPVAA